ncbi:MAG: hypothetical protein M0Q95_12860 [Porticoccaceae bacterium]|nr:hypothetical protein [Porticoccaceae bacterium]
MGDVIDFKKPKAKKLGMCQHGFHDWVIWQNKKFDVSKGKLITVFRCSRCGAQKVQGL